MFCLRGFGDVLREEYHRPLCVLSKEIFCAKYVWGNLLGFDKGQARKENVGNFTKLPQVWAKPKTTSIAKAGAARQPYKRKKKGRDEGNQPMVGWGKNKVAASVALKDAIAYGMASAKKRRKALDMDSGKASDSDNDERPRTPGSVHSASGSELALTQIKTPNLGVTMQRGMLLWEPPVQELQKGGGIQGTPNATKIDVLVGVMETGPPRTPITQPTPASASGGGSKAAKGTSGEKQYVLWEVFSGTGVLGHTFSREFGFDVYQIDCDRDLARKTGAVCCRVEDFDFDLWPKPHVIFFAPPCNPWSNSNKRAARDTQELIELGLLSKWALELVEKYKPVFWILENPSNTKLAE